VALSTKTRYTFDRANFEAVVGPGLKHDIEQRSAQVRTLARALAPRGQTGRLRQSIGWVVEGERLNWTGYIFIDDTIAPHGVYVAFGTGVYGPSRRVIRAHDGGFMKFKTADGRWVRTRTVQGQRRQDFLPNALRAARD